MSTRATMPHKERESQSHRAANYQIESRSHALNKHAQLLRASIRQTLSNPSRVLSEQKGSHHAPRVCPDRELSNVPQQTKHTAPSSCVAPKR